MKKNKYGTDFTIYNNSQNKVNQEQKLVELIEVKVDTSNFKNKQYSAELLDLITKHYDLMVEKCAEIDEINFLKLNIFQTYPYGVTTNEDNLKKDLEAVKEAYKDLRKFMNFLIEQKDDNEKFFVVRDEEDIKKISDYLSKLDFKEHLETKYAVKNTTEKRNKI